MKKSTVLIIGIGEVGQYLLEFLLRGDLDINVFAGPYWLALEEIPENADVIQSVLEKQSKIEKGNQVQVEGIRFHWEELSFSKTIGLAKPSPWGGHSGYPDGHYDKNFIHLKKGRKLLYTRIYSPIKQQVGLNVQLRNSASQLWVNGKKESFQGPTPDRHQKALLCVADRACAPGLRRSWNLVTP